jgi:acyl-CoA hydrolase/GNAT superfamily N-acetyltransferase
MKRKPKNVLNDNIMRGVKDKITTPDKAVSLVRSGDRVFVGTACATPRKLIEALETRGMIIHDVQMIHFLTDGTVPMVNGKPDTKYQHKVFFVGTDMKETIKQGKADYIPISIAQVPTLIENGKITIDVAMIQVSPPDTHGYVSLGVSVDITRAAVMKAKKVIAEINPNMPTTLGDTFIPVDRIDKMVLVDTPIIEYQHAPIDAVAEQIAKYVARIVDNGSTLQIGLGRIPNEMLKYLTESKDLGIHTDVITDPIVDLIEKGVITGKEKSTHPGQVVTSYCMGTKRLYRMIHMNPKFSFKPIDYVCDPAILARTNKFVSVSQAFAVDLTGQVCSDQFEGEFYSGVSSQPDFLRGAANSPGGKPIICLPSTTDDGKKSRIRPLLLEGEGVTISRSDVHYVITEYGMAYLFGKSSRDRALSLIEIAHPSFRETLLEEGKRLGYLRHDQTLHSKVAYPEKEEQEVELKDGKKVLIRPAKASDVRGLQEIFYSLPLEDIRTRFFICLKSLSVSEAEYLCNVDYENEMALMAVTGERENEIVVGSSCYFVDQTTNIAEVAYMILPEWQGIGLGAALQKRMTEYAKSKGIRGFRADILPENTKMMRLAQQGENVSIKPSGGVAEVTTLFDEK